MKFKNGDVVVIRRTNDLSLDGVTVEIVGRSATHDNVGGIYLIRRIDGELLGGNEVLTAGESYLDRVEE